MPYINQDGLLDIGAGLQIITSSFVIRYTVDECAELSRFGTAPNWAHSIG